MLGTETISDQISRGGKKRRSHHLTEKLKGIGRARARQDHLAYDSGAESGGPKTIQKSQSWQTSANFAITIISPGQLTFQRSIWIEKEPKADRRVDSQIKSFGGGTTVLTFHDTNEERAAELLPTLRRHARAARPDHRQPGRRHPHGYGEFGPLCRRRTAAARVAGGCPVAAQDGNAGRPAARPVAQSPVVPPAENNDRRISTNLERQSRGGRRGARFPAPRARPSSLASG